MEKKAGMFGIYNISPGCFKFQTSLLARKL
jgi:hypothetical protein